MKSKNSLFLVVITLCIIVGIEWLLSERHLFNNDKNDEANKLKIFSKYLDRNCSFMTFKYIGRTGNQMFQYASFYGLAKTNKMKPFIKYPEFPLLKVFKITTPVFSEPYFDKTFVPISEASPYIYNETSTQLDCDKNYRMHGYRSSWKYFEKYSKEIKNEFQFQTDISYLCNKAIFDVTQQTNVSQSNCLFIGAHMRRGDFASEKRSVGYVPASGEYLEKAISFFESRFRNESCLLFLVIGDDYQWNLENAPKRPNIFVSKLATPYIDMCILSRCNHTIISSGTFGWWAAYLAGGYATYMKHQCRPNSILCSDFDYDSYINPKWNWYPL